MGQVFGDRSERSFSRRFICEVLEARAIEMLEMIGKTRLRTAATWIAFPAGIVLTGGCQPVDRL